MPNHLNVPSDLTSLIEKREQERRQQEADAKNQSADEATAKDTSQVERRSGQDRRTNDKS